VTFIRDDQKLIHYIGYPDLEEPYELYDLADDPDELENLYASSLPMASAMRDEIHAKLEQINLPLLR
jgi:hypothetical protein